MLTKLILIKSCTYDLAEIDLTRGRAMQLLGGNNVGKSSLICALNFLFVIDRKQMIFSGERKADKTTLQYYFPEAEGSFIVFEVSKRGKSYCMVVWRDGPSSTEYLQLQQAYTREHFFDTGDHQKLKPRRLKELLTHWTTSGYRYRRLNGNPAVFDTVYGSGRRNDAVVWLRTSAQGGAGRTFSKLYRYLIDTRLIDTDSLKEILLMADGRGHRSIRYGQSSLTEIERLKRHGRHIRRLKEVQNNFDALRLAHLQLEQGENSLRETAGFFIQHCTRVRAQLSAEQAEQEDRRRRAKDRLRHTRSQLSQLLEEIGRLKGEGENLIQSRQRLEQQLTAIQGLPDINLIEAKIQELEADIRRREYRLADEEAQDLSVTELQRQLNRREQEIDRKTRDEVRINDWLIHHLATDETDRRRLYALLSETISRLPAAAVKQRLTRTDREVRLYDGVFQLPDDLELPELPTPEALAQELTKLKKKRDRDRERLTTARKREQLLGELKDKRKELERLRRDRELARTEEEVRADILGIAEQIRELQSQIDRQAQRRKELTETEEAQQEKINILQREELERTTKLERIERMWRRVDTFGLTPIEAEETSQPLTAGELDRAYTALNQDYERQREAAAAFRADFTELRRQLDSETADPARFIEELQRDYEQLPDLRANVDSLIRNIGNAFANPAADLLNEYGKFEEFVRQKFNRKLSKLTISNIEQLRIELLPNTELHRDLEEIGHLQLGEGGLFEADGADLRVLTRYIESGREVAFTDLFGLQLRIRINGQDKKVDLGRQVESDGTDRMLRLVLVMQVISQLVHLEAENRLVVFVDEIATLDARNRPQLVEFCRDHHFYPIFAAPETVEGFDRYVVIAPPDGAGGTVVEAGKHYLDVERN